MLNSMAGIQLTNVYSPKDGPLKIVPGGACGLKPVNSAKNVRVDFGHGDYWRRLREILPAGMRA